MLGGRALGLRELGSGNTAGVWGVGFREIDEGCTEE